MNKDRIKKLANFFYDSDNSQDVPLRLSIVIGQYAGFDLGKDDFIDLMTILTESKTLKSDLAAFLLRFSEADDD